MIKKERDDTDDQIAQTIPEIDALFVELASHSALFAAGGRFFADVDASVTQGKEPKKRNHLFLVKDWA